MYSLFAQATEKSKVNPTVPSTNYFEFMFEWWFLLGMAILLGLIGFLVYRMMRKPE